MRAGKIGAHYTQAYGWRLAQSRHNDQIIAMLGAFVSGTYTYADYGYVAMHDLRAE